MKNLKIFFLILIPTFFYPQKIRVFILAGQSNMNGFGYNKDLPNDLKSFKEIYIFQGNSVPDGDLNGGTGKWDVLKPGNGTGFKTNGKSNQLSDRFGLELSFAKRIKELFPNDKIALIKYAREGTSIDSVARGGFGCWDADFHGTNGISQYDNFLKTLKNALAETDIDGDGKIDELLPSGILWMQGEGDASHDEEIASRYYGHLKVLMNQMRAALLTDDLPVVIGKISDSGKNEKGKVWPTGELVQYAQEKFVKDDKRAAVVRSTIRYNYGNDPWHYDSAGYIDLGKNFAEEVFRLIIK
ncbi:sialate O-acetylesterase [Chryseobacterium sp. 09-1422]|uniref:Sialate O-acetylesterase n=1 Tax=Chryseobacterium kimseyorum TaxID=2984028 RepID=A0ABT3HWU7_9FLAO|nr:sialate O-acetylesterase [Chryseobacterium kimseyorum]MCW3168234.1 sialate O-acetylesterase [Chryseobacterium kimseyorum]